MEPGTMPSQRIGKISATEIVTRDFSAVGGGTAVGNPSAGQAASTLEPRWKAWSLRLRQQRSGDA
jgi:hypothetical protein